MKQQILASTTALLLAASVLHGQTVFQELDINNVQAGMHAEGNLFWDFSGQSSFQIPKGGGVGTIFSANLWMGGLDDQDELHLFANRYWSSGADLRPGPIMNEVFYSAEFSKWNRVWKVSTAEIETHLMSYNDPNYSAPADIMDWPAHGSQAMGQAPDLAPYIDHNNNGVYDPQNGDYPAIRGDQAVYFLVNDQGLHFETGGTPLGVQVACMAYAFDCSTDEALNNTIFLHYEISQDAVAGEEYHDVYLGLWADFDIGTSTDDYVGCDVERSTFFGYNGLDVDASIGGKQGYEDHPPAQGVVVLRGPYQDIDAVDNAVGVGANESVNGYGYGDNVVDNERLGMTGFMHYSNGGGPNNPALQDPTAANEYYNALRNIWKDDVPLTHGGNGYADTTDTNALVTRFSFPGDSDPLHYGTNGVQPASTWAEHLEVGNLPFDRRGMGISGPFTFEANEVIELDYAFVYGRDLNGTALQSVDAMKANVDDIRAMFESGTTACGNDFGFFTSAPAVALTTNNLQVYPNPFADQLRIEGLENNEAATFRLTDPAGRLIRSGVLNANNAVLDFSQLDAGLYLLQVDGEETNELHRVVKR